MKEIDPLVSSFVHLKEKPREADALKTLQRVASLVKPLMRQRGWRVGALVEFFPPEANLLGEPLDIPARLVRRPDRV